MKNLFAFFSGLLFATGLIMSGMTLPKNIVGFLDIFGNWRPELGFVMLGAVSVYAIFYRLIRKRVKPLFADSFDISPLKKIDRPLLIGAGIFGVGWGLSGLCPGPAVVSLGSGALDAVIFVLAMMAGMNLYRVLFMKPSLFGDDDVSCG